MKVYEIIKAVRWEGHSSQGLYLSMESAVKSLHLVAENHNKEVSEMWAESDEEDMKGYESVKWDSEKGAYDGQSNSFRINEREVLA